MASWMLVIGLTLIVTQRAWGTGGIHAPVAVFYTIFTIMAGALLNTRAAIITACVSLAAAAFLAAAEIAGWRAAPAHGTTAAGAFVFVLLTLALTVLAQLFIASMTARARAQNDDAVRMLVHDMRSPMTSVLAQLSMIREEAPAAAQRIDEAMGGVETLHRMTGNLLDLGRFEAGKMPVRRSLTNVSSLVRQAAKTLSPLDPDREIDVSGDSSIAWPCDRELLRRVMDNLIVNAIKHTPRGTAIWINIASQHDRLLISVQDQGPGIPAELRQQVFERYNAAALTSPAGYASTGLGLAFCKVAIEAQGGSIRILDADPRGTIFLIEIPA
jgi:K+-sensing histidine kinase KdpD